MFILAVGLSVPVCMFMKKRHMDLAFAQQYLLYGFIGRWCTVFHSFC